MINSKLALGKPTLSIRRSHLNLSITASSPKPEVALVSLEGEIDVYTSTKLKQDLTQIIADGAKFVVLNLSKVEYLDSTGLGLLIGALKRLRENKGNLVIVSPSTRITRVFEITGLYKVFSIYASETEAAEKEGIEL